MYLWRNTYNYCVCHAFVPVHCNSVVTCCESAYLLTLVCDAKLYFCHFPMWYPGSGVVLDQFLIFVTFLSSMRQHAEQGFSFSHHAPRSHSLGRSRPHTKLVFTRFLCIDQNCARDSSKQIFLSIFILGNLSMKLCLYL